MVLNGLRDRQINLFPWRQQQYKWRRRAFIFSFIIFVFLGSALLKIEDILLDYQIKKYDLRKKHLLDRLSRLVFIEQQTNRLKQEIVVGQNLLRTVSMNRVHIREALDFLTNLRKLAAPSLFIKVLEYDPSFLHFLASFPTKESCLTLMNSLQKKYGHRLKWDFIKNKKRIDSLLCEFQITLEL